MKARGAERAIDGEEWIEVGGVEVGGDVLAEEVLDGLEAAREEVGFVGGLGEDDHGRRRCWVVKGE